MKKIVINQCYGGFGLSHAAMMLYAELKGIVLVYEATTYGFNHYHKQGDGANNYFYDYDIPRDDKSLVQVVETLGQEANGGCARLGIVEIPEDVEWQIGEYDGREHIAERHRTWE